MKELHFQRAGRMHVAHQGNRRFVIHEQDQGEIVLAKVFEREGKRREPIASKFCATKAEAIDWLARYRVAA